MQNITEQDVINYAQERHHIPAAYAKNWYRFWTERNWITTTGKAILNWQTKFDWWVLDHIRRLRHRSLPFSSDCWAERKKKSRSPKKPALINLFPQELVN